MGHLGRAYNESGDKELHIDRLPLNAMIGALAAMVGEFALRSQIIKAGLSVRPGHGWVHGSAADGLLFRDGRGYRGAKAIGLSVWDFIAPHCPANEHPDLDAIVARTEAAIGGSPFPPLTIPNDQYPSEWSPNACVRHRQAVMTLALEHGESDPAGIAASLGIGIAVLVGHSNSPAIMAQLAAEVMIGTARMIPLEKEW